MIQEKMFDELREKTIFDQVQQYAYDYLDTVQGRNVFPTADALNGLTHFEGPLPLETTSPKDVLTQLNTYGAPATMAQLGGRYYGFVNGSSVPVGLAAKTLATYWDQNTALQIISPLVSKLELVVEGWLKSLFHFPESTVAGFVSGTSAANLCGLAAARYRILKNLDWDINEKGLMGSPQIRIVAGNQIHSSVMKALNLLGIGRQSVEYVETDEQGRLLADKMPILDSTTIVILQAGNVNSGSFDPFEVVCKKANDVGAWVHVDGAFGLWAGAISHFDHLTDGLNKAQSWAVDGHKTLNTPYDSGIILCADEESLVSALHSAGSYIIRGDGRDGMFYTSAMSRRSRIIELWAILKYLGKSGIDEMIIGLHERALQFASLFEKVEGFEVLNDVVFNQVMIQCASDELTLNVMENVQEQRICWAGSSMWKDRKVIRISVCSWATTKEDVRRSVESFRRALVALS